MQQECVVLTLEWFIVDMLCLSLQGVVSGVTGVVTKPIEGARHEGVGGFFKGAALYY